MHQREMEWFAFLILCGKRDREILFGKDDVFRLGQADVYF